MVSHAPQYFVGMSHDHANNFRSASFTRGRNSPHMNGSGTYNVNSYFLSVAVDSTSSDIGATTHNRFKFSPKEQRFLHPPRKDTWLF